jgi:hypothetical protein
MKILTGLILYFIPSLLLLIAQSNNNIDNLQKHYESFEYSKVISESNNLLLDKDRFSDQSLINVYTLKAASHYAMGDKTNSRKSFIELLKIDDEYELDNVTYSPKLITFFNEVNKEFLDIIKANGEKQKSEKEVDTANIIQQTNISNTELNTAFAKSLALPGWGHLHLNNDTKGWILTSAGTVALGSMIYFIFETNSKERDYLSETNSQLIQTKYDEYNKSYKVKNTLIVTYAVIWLYSQIDILFFTNELGSKYISAQIQDKFKPAKTDKITLSFRIPL